ncbi:MAG: serine/threonine protein kinase [Labilithrix sp.]|nr:serine/threonine protein kinase [Labilithrix sp.]
MTARRVGDRFVVERPLGAGGMGSIFLGRDERLGDAVAIKILKRALLDDPIVRERFRREALSLAKLRHPGIVGVLDCGEDAGDLYTVLELVQGETLERRMQREGPMAVARALPIFDRVLEALETCHAAEIVHRDLKPSNVMIDGDGEAPSVKLIDFGLARIVSAAEKLTETGAVQGTPHYMAPEQCRGEEVGPAADVYAAGVLFYEMLSGEAPFQAADSATIMAQHLFVEPASLRQIAPEVPAGIAAAVHAALAKAPADRPTARALRDALVAAAAGTDPETRALDAAKRRRHASTLGRDARAIARAPGEARAAGAVDGEIIVWMSRDRSAAICGCLGAAGLTCATATSDEPPDASRAAAVVVSARDDLSRVRSLRANDRALPIVVVDVAGPDETTASIRAGASDMLLREAPDADLASKITRLLRRRGRA